MADEQRPEGEMIEIGDPTEDPAGLGHEPPPRVVIEYRDRGVPWLLIPPLLVLAAIVAVVATPALRPEPERIAAPVPVPANPGTEGPNAPPVSVAVTIPPVDATPAPTVPPVAAPVDPAPAEPTPAPPAFPRVPGLGFDPDALKAEPKPEAPADPAIAPAGQEPAGVAVPDRAGLPALPEADKQPAEVDPNVLPPDPRRALQLRLRRAAEARRKANEDRGRFHAELAAILRRQGDRSAPAIQELCLKYGSEVDPAVKQQAVQLLGVRGIAAGASRSVRINLLRSEGFPEAAILRDIFDQDLRLVSTEKGLSKAVRGGPRSMDEVFCAAAMVLLNNPPRRAATPASTRSDRVGPSASRGLSAPGTSSR